MRDKNSTLYRTDNYPKDHLGMKYGEYLESHMVPEWREYYVSYGKLKKILKVLTTKLLSKTPAEWTIGVSLSTPAPTNAAVSCGDDPPGHCGRFSIPVKSGPCFPFKTPRHPEQRNPTLLHVVH